MIGKDAVKNAVALGRQEVTNFVENKPIDTPAPESNTYAAAIQEQREAPQAPEPEQERSR